MNTYQVNIIIGGHLYSTRVVDVDDDTTLTHLLTVNSLMLERDLTEDHSMMQAAETRGIKLEIKPKLEAKPITSTVQTVSALDKDIADEQRLDRLMSRKGVL